MQKIVPHLWFDGDAETAAKLYTELIPGAAIGRVTRYGKAGFAQHGQPEGRAMTVEVDLAGTRMVLLNGGPHFRSTPAVSYVVTLEAAADVERAWAGLAEGGTALLPLGATPWSPNYGWLQDRFGVSWQIVQGSGGGTVTPSLLFTGQVAGQAEAAIAHYTAVFPTSERLGVRRHEGDGKDAPGTLKHAEFRLFGQRFMASDSALEHTFGFSPANSFLVLCADQDEVDRYWQALSAVPEAERCGWLADRFGVSWQIVPQRFVELMADPDATRVARVTEAFMAMGKLEIAALERAAHHG